MKKPVVLVRLGQALLVIGCLSLGVRNASASSITFDLVDDHACTGTCGTGPFGTVVVSTINAVTVDVLVTLKAGEGFVSTGGGHEALTWNITGDPFITIGALPAGYAVGPTGLGVPGLGTFNYSLHCPGCGPGASHAKPGPLEFTISLASGLTPSMFVANSSGYTFSADIIGTNGHTGSVAALAPNHTTETPVPEPATLGLMGLGLGASARKLRKKGSDLSF